MACLGKYEKQRRSKMARSSERASPVLKEILLKLYRAETPMDFDHCFSEFGSVEYRVEASAMDSGNVYLSILTPSLLQGHTTTEQISPQTVQLVEGICPGVLEVVEPAREGYRLTLRLNLAKIPQGKDSTKVLTEIATVQSVIASSQLKEILRDFSSDDAFRGMSKPIKIVYHPRQPFFIIRQPQTITAIVPIQFQEITDAIIATPFFQELVDISNSDEWAKVPRCMWSPIPPCELRGESVDDLSTNGGFVSFDILPRHVDDKRIDQTAWSLLNFHTYVKSFVKGTRGFIQRRMRKRSEDLVMALKGTNRYEDEHADDVPGCGCTMKVKYSPNLKKVRRKCGEFNRKIKRIRNRVKIQGFSHFHRRCYSMSGSGSSKYIKLE